MDISVDTDLVKRLDEVRKQNNLPPWRISRRPSKGPGIAWEDYKTQIRNGILTQEVIRQQVGGRLDIPSEEVKKYYDAHKDQFNRPEQVELAEIFLSTEGKSPEEIAAVRTKADDLHNRVVKGEDFTEIAKRYSEGSTAKDGGDLGRFERGQLAPQLEDAVFKLDRNGVTDVIQTKTGFEILKVIDHYDAGLQPLDKVESEITNKLYTEKMEPALRTYLAELREESYVMVKPGYTDTAAVQGATVIQEVAPTPDTPKKKKKLPIAEGLRLMKSHFVVDLSDGQIVVSHFLVREKEMRTSVRTGTSWLQLELVDRTGAISGKMWDNFAAPRAHLRARRRHPDSRPRQALQRPEGIDARADHSRPRARLRPQRFSSAHEVRRRKNVRGAACRRRGSEKSLAEALAGKHCVTTPRSRRGSSAPPRP